MSLECLSPIDVTEIQLSIKEHVNEGQDFTLPEEYQVAIVPFASNQIQINASGNAARPLQVVPHHSSFTASNDYTRPTNVGSLNITYTGAYSGMYNFTITGKHGAMLDNGQTLCVRTEIVDFEPAAGSLWGGALVRIWGNNFVDKEGFNAVKMGHTIGSTIDQYCYVEDVYRGAIVPAGDVA